MIRLEDVTYLVRDHEEAIAFSTDAIGFVVRQDDALPGGWRRVVVGPEGPGVVFREEPRHEPYGTVAVFEDPSARRGT